MKTKFMHFLILFAASRVMAGYAPGDSLIVTGSVTINRDTTFKFVRVESGGELTADSAITVTGNMIIQSGGVVTHSTRLLSGLQLNVSGTLEVQAGGLIDLNSKGLRGGNNGSAFGYVGETFDANEEIISAGNGAGFWPGGASYGGQAGNGRQGVANNTYGLLEKAQLLGSGGGGTYDAFNQVGGNGGGRVTIIAGNLILNGTISAIGGNGSCCYGNAGGGGGSGGSIKLQVGHLSGSGFIQALGGSAGSGNGGSGGGGRIAIYYDTMTFLIANISAYGGNVGGKGSAGTIYLKDRAQADGDLIIDNGNVASPLDTPLKAALNTFRSLIIRNRGHLRPMTTDIKSFIVKQPIFLTNAAELLLSAGTVMGVTNSTGFDLDAQSGSSVTLDSGSVLNANALRFNGGTLNTHINLNFPTATDLELSGGGVINILHNTIFNVGSFDTTNIQSGTVNLTLDSRLNIATNTATIGSGVTLIKDGKFKITDSLNTLTIKSGGAVTHSTRLLPGLRLNVGGTLDVQAGGLIDLNSKGLHGGNNGSAFGYVGETFDANEAIISAENGAGFWPAGASYGGQAGNGRQGVANSSYGLLEYPHHLGSGGGGSTSEAFNQVGGNGGGRATIVVKTLLLNGTISAIGGNGSCCYGNAGGGGGSGGSVKLQVSNFQGRVLSKLWAAMRARVMVAREAAAALPSTMTR